MGRDCLLRALLVVLLASGSGAAPAGFVTKNMQALDPVGLIGSAAVGDRGLMASFYAQLDHDIYFPSPCSPDPSCTTPTLLPCCPRSICQSPNRTVSHCYCPRRESYVCLDGDERSRFAGHMLFNERRRFAIGFAPGGCQDVAIAVSPRNIATVHFAVSYSFSSLVLCTEQQTPTRPEIDIILSTDAAFFGVSFTIRVWQTTPAAPKLLLPLNYLYYSFSNATASLSCPDSPPIGLHSSLLTYPTTDPAFAYGNEQVLVMDVFQAAPPANMIAFNVLMWADSNAVWGNEVLLSPNTNLTECVLTLDGLVDAAGSPYPSSSVSFSPLAPNCTRAALQPVLDTINGVGNLITDSVYYNLLRAAVPSLMVSNPWVGCSNLLSSLLDSDTSSMVATYTACLASIGTPEFASDPCCNATVAYESQCCMPRTQLTDVTRWVVNEDAVSARCNNPICTQQFLSSNLAGVTSLTSAACRAAELETVADPRLSLSILTQCGLQPGTNSQVLPIPCTNDSECLFSGVCEPNPAFVASSPVAAAFPLTQPVCRLAVNDTAAGAANCYLHFAHPLLRLLLLSVLNLSSDTSDEVLTAGLLAEFGHEGCLQVPSQRFEDGNGTCSCATAGDCYCDWAPSLSSETACADHQWRGDHFCASGVGCDWGGPCTEVSRFEGCFYSYGGDDTAPADKCSAAGGQVVSAGSPPEVNCWFPALQSEAACLPSAFCPASHVRTLPAMAQTWCDSYCVLRSLASAASCSCRKTAQPSLCARYGLQWNASLGECLLALDPTSNSTTEAADCSAIGGSYWHGAFWQEDLYVDQASCEAHGLCSSDPVSYLAGGTLGSYTAAECANMVGCDVAAGAASAAECAASGLCTSLLELDRCSSSPVVMPYSGAPTCHSDCAAGPLIPGASCLCPEDADGCVFQSLNVWTPLPPTLPVITESECLAPTACLLPNSTVLSPKPPADCVSCGGVVHPRNAWFSGRWGPGVHTPFGWRPRTWRSSWVPGRILSLHQSTPGWADPGGALGAFSLQSEICQQQLQWNVLPLLACDCADDAVLGCYDTPQVQRAAQTVVCVGEAASFWPLIDGDSPSFGLNSSAAAQVVTSSNLGCSSLSFLVAQQQLFERPSSSPFSSLLLSTIRVDACSIIRNDAGVPVAQLRGDVVQVHISSSAVLDASIFCLCDRGGDAAPSSFSVYDFASFNQSGTSFSPLALSLFTSSDRCRAVCVNGTRGGFFAPILRLPNPAHASWAELLSPAESHIFLTAVVLFSALGALAAFRFLSLLVANRASPVASGLALSQLALLALFCFLRALLFGLLYSGFIPFEASLGLFAFAEIPTMIEFSLAAFVVFIWARSYHSAAPPAGSTTSGSTHKGWSLISVLVIAANALFVAVFVSTLIALASLGPSPALTACAAPAFPPQAALDRAYKVMVALIALLLSLLLALYAFLNARSLRVHGVAGFPFWQFVAIAMATIVGLLVQSILVFYIAFQPGTVLVLVAGAAAELLRPAALLLTARLRGWREDWCFGVQRKEEATIAHYAMLDDM